LGVYLRTAVRSSETACEPHEKQVSSQSGRPFGPFAQIIASTALTMVRSALSRIPGRAESETRMLWGGAHLEAVLRIRLVLGAPQEGRSFPRGPLRVRRHVFHSLTFELLPLGSEPHPQSVLRPETRRARDRARF
jgi:hypothetical protein